MGVSKIRKKEKEKKTETKKKEERKREKMGDLSFKDQFGDDWIGQRKA